MSTTPQQTSSKFTSPKDEPDYQAFRRGERQAFDMLARAYCDKILNLAWDLTRSRDDARDLAQEVFVKAFRRCGDFDGRSTLGTWLYRITVNTFLDQKRKKRPDRLDDDEELLDTNTGYRPDTVLDQQITSELLRLAMSSLSPRQQSVVALRHLQGLSVEETANVLGVSEGTVKTLHFRAMDTLRKVLSKDFKGAK